jgi:hypothetical protein
VLLVIPGQTWQSVPKKPEPAGHWQAPLTQDPWVMLPQLVAVEAPSGTQTEVPEEQEVLPVWQGSLGAQERFAVQATQLPARQTRLAPHEVPSGRLVVVSLHTGVPVEQSVVPAWQELGTVQLAPWVQALQVPFEQTMLVPQLVPSALLPESVQTGAPVAHRTIAVWQGLEEVQLPPSAQLTHVPLGSQTW